MIITSVVDVIDLKPGDSFIISPPGFDTPDHDVEAFAEAYAELAEEVHAAVDALLAPPVPSPIEYEFDGGSRIKLYIPESMLPAVVDGDARKRTVTQSPTTVTLQKTRTGYITVGDMEILYGA